MDGCQRPSLGQLLPLLCSPEDQGLLPLQVPRKISQTAKIEEEMPCLPEENCGNDSHLLTDDRKVSATAQWGQCAMEPGQHRSRGFHLCMASGTFIRADTSVNIPRGWFGSWHHPFSTCSRGYNLKLLQISLLNAISFQKLSSSSPSLTGLNTSEEAGMFLIPLIY